MGERANGIGELNESSLHAQLKALYLADGGAGEVAIGRYVADVVLGDGRVVEVQTSRLGRIKGKLAALLAERPVRLAFPVTVEKRLVVYDAKGRDVLYRRRSPKRGSILSMVDELIGVAGLLLHPAFEVEVLLTLEEESRRSDGSGSWRRKGVAKVDRQVLQVLERRLFCGAADYARLLPDPCPPSFDNRELAAALGVPLERARKVSYCLRAAGALRVASREKKGYVFERVAAKEGSSQRRRRAH